MIHYISNILTNAILSDYREDFFMLLIEGNKIKKYFGDKLILDIDQLKIYSEDRIGIVGRNGVGKTTLMNILAQRVEPDEGLVKLYAKASYISQLETPEHKAISNEMASKFGVEAIWDERMSGGEKTRFKLAEALECGSAMVIADEPTSNIDMEGIELIEQKFSEFKGALMVISHDRNFLDKLCNQILEIEEGKIKIYKGNYSDYNVQKLQQRQRVEFEYEQYQKQKKRLEQVAEDTKQKVKSMRKTPKRMGNSEARLHKMGPQRSKANLERAAKSVEKRIEQLEVKEKPRQQHGIQLDVLDSNKIYSKIIIEGKNINKAFGDKIIFNNAAFSIYNGSKVAFIGPNGCGKSTLVKMIMEHDQAIRVVPAAKIGYFSQDMDILDHHLSILENVMQTSIYLENFARLLLARLLFKAEAVYKKVDILSGGEQVKVSLAKILLQDINLLMLDEPTNYLDINALEVIEETLKEYDRTLLFVSHDRRLIHSVADHIMTIENQKIKLFDGSYDQYLAKDKNVIEPNKKELEQQRLVLKNRLSEIIGRLSMPSKQDNIEDLDRQYYQILEELKGLKD
jgi:macrolide transport system ATP-binding/permease protein